MITLADSSVKTHGKAAKSTLPVGTKMEARHRLKRKFLYALFLLLIPGGTSAADLAAGPILFGGTGTLTADVSHPAFHHIDNYEFAVSNTSWGIRIESPEFPTAQVFCNGTTVYILTFVRPVSNPDPALQRRYGRQASVEQIQSSPLPCDLLPGTMALGYYNLNLTWFANCSSAYIHNSGLNSVPVPWSAPHIGLRAYYYAAEGDVFKDGLGLPRSIRWIFSAAVAKQAIHRPELVRETLTLEDRESQVDTIPAGLPGEETEYTVLASTTVSGVSVPEAFVMKHVFLSPGATATQTVSMVVEGRQKVTGTVNPALLSLPTSATGYDVTDHRFRHKTKLVDTIQYATNNPVKADFSDPGLQSKFSEKVAAAPTDPANRSR